jgi:protein subunit release factor B
MIAKLVFFCTASLLIFAIIQSLVVNRLLLSRFSLSIAGTLKNDNKNDIILNEDEIDEKFVKGTGCGGQKINKTSNRVVLTHKPTGIKVSCQDARDLSTNRKWAREMLIGKLDAYYNGENSKIYQEILREKKRKQNATRKSKKKYANLEENKTDENKDNNEVNDGNDDDDDDVDTEKLVQLLRERKL